MGLIATEFKIEHFFLIEDYAGDNSKPHVEHELCDKQSEAPAVIVPTKLLKCNAKTDFMCSMCDAEWSKGTLLEKPKLRLHFKSMVVEQDWLILRHPRGYLYSIPTDQLSEPEHRLSTRVKF